METKGIINVDKETFSQDLRNVFTPSEHLALVLTALEVMKLEKMKESQSEDPKTIEEFKHGLGSAIAKLIVTLPSELSNEIMKLYAKEGFSISIKEVVE